MERREAPTRAILQIEGLSTRERVTVLLIQGEYAQMSTRSGEPLPLFEALLADVRTLGAKDLEARVLLGMGNVHNNRGAYDDARQCHQAALALNRTLGRVMDEGIVLGNLANAFHQTGQVEAAMARHRQALAIHRRTGNRLSEGMVFGLIGEVRLRRGELEEAARMLTQAIAQIDSHRRVLCLTLSDVSGMASGVPGGSGDCVGAAQRHRAGPRRPGHSPEDPVPQRSRPGVSPGWRRPGGEAMPCRG